MKITAPKALRMALEESFERVYNINENEIEVDNFLQECIMSLAVFSAIDDDTEYLDVQMVSFEIGFEVATSMKPGDRVFRVGTVALDYPAFYYFVGPSVKEVIKCLRHATEEWVKSLRKDV